MLFFYHADMAELVDALDLGSSGKPWGFESLYPHQTRIKRTMNKIYCSFYNLTVINYKVMDIFYSCKKLCL